jgi:hypothetical protein
MGVQQKFGSNQRSISNNTRRLLLDSNFLGKMEIRNALELYDVYFIIVIAKFLSGPSFPVIRFSSS